uniref:Replication initiator protein n=1 Tax=Dulem virus 188 TaxID=3145665 RepID=A0AAU8B395_9VIRU
MSCYHPLMGIPKGIDPRSGKMQYLIKSFPKGFQGDNNIDGIVTIPCGKCIGCRLDYSRQWANRCMLEMKYHEEAWFVTLTYDNAHVPMSWYSDPSTGEALQAMTLRKRDFQLFMKRLRKDYEPQKIRFFAAGEYGDKHLRPHYHAILFGLHLDDLQLYEEHVGDYPYYTSEKLQKCWDKGLDNFTVLCNNLGKGSITPLATRGMVIIAPVNWQTCAYVARYVMKKQKGPQSEVYQAHNIEPPFSLMSRRPGIGRQYYDDHPNLYDYEFLNISTEEGGRKFRPPKYFDRLRMQDHPEDYEKLRDFRRNAADETKTAKLSQTDNEYLNMLEIEERNQQAVLNSLERNL